MTQESIEPTAAEAFAERLAAIASPQRLRILAELVAGEQHVSELARRVEMSRALLYMHLRKLEAAGYVVGRLELGDDGKAVRIYSVEPFALSLSPQVIAEVVAEEQRGKRPQ